MALFNANQVIGKNLVAKDNVLVYFRYPNSAETAIYSAGDNIGRVTSWIKDKTDGSIWWQFAPVNGKNYYAHHETGLFDIKTLEAQGAMSVEAIVQKQKEDQDKEEKGSFVYYAERWGKPILLTVAGLYVIHEVARSRPPSKGIVKY